MNSLDPVLEGQRTLALIKPDAVANGATGNIVALIEAAGFRICAIRMLRLNRERVSAFYAAHREAAVFRRSDADHDLGARRRGGPRA